MTTDSVKDTELHCSLDVVPLTTASGPSSIDVGVSGVPRDAGLVSSFFAIHGFTHFAGTHLGGSLPVETQR